MQVYDSAIEQNEVSVTSTNDNSVTMIAEAISLMQKQANDFAGAPDLCPHELFSLFTANIIKEKLTFTR